MSISHKFWIWCLVLLALVIVPAGMAIVQLRTIWTSARASIAHYEAMDRADAVAVRVGWLRDSLRAADGTTYLDARFFDPIRLDMTRLSESLALAARGEAYDGVQADLADALTRHFDAANTQATTSAPDKTRQALAVAAELDRATQSMAGLSKLAPNAARRQTSLTIVKIESSLWWTCLWLLVALVLSALVHYRQYRLLVRPLVALRDDIARSKAANFALAVASTGEKPFREVATYFNGLARELAELYRGLEEKIVERSRALVRSERLASVGFLAAGVAHEINNPLGIISGYAELSAKRIRNVLDADHAANHATSDEHAAESIAAAEAESLSAALETQEIIREEAFRCKEITNRLLSLARGGTDGREPIRIDELARHVAVLTRGLRNYRDRVIHVDFADGSPLEVIANPTEMKQVLLNLTVNALEASTGNLGEVRIGGRRDRESVELYVQDVGKGIANDQLPKIFEPFYTDKRGVGEAGTGLGLTITHAIIENHHGTITAESAGVGRGSRFTIRLPASESSKPNTTRPVATH